MPQHNLADALIGLDPGLPRPERAGGANSNGKTCLPDGSRAGAADCIRACDGVIDLLAVFFNVSGRQLRSSSRISFPVSRVRQIGMYVAHVTFGMTMTDVGTGFGRNKSTVVHACHTIEDLRDDEDFDLVVARFEKLVAIAFSLDQGRGAE